MPTTTQAAQPTIHHPRPPIVPQNSQHAWQRYFGNSAAGLGQYLLVATDLAMAPRCCVMRNAAFDVAEMNISLGVNTDARITICMTPAELRELAARLIDAAHDIEAFPAAILAGGAA